MPLPVLCSLALMLQLMSSLVHFVAIVSPAWVQLGIWVPALSAEEWEAWEAEVSNGTAGGSQNPAEDYSGPRMFVKVRLGLWHWCQQFRQVSPTCQEPGFLAGFGVLALIALLSFSSSFVLLTYSSCLKSEEVKRRRLFISLSLSASCFSGVIVWIMVIIYAVLTRREVTHLMSLTGNDPELSYLGWAYGADVVSMLLAGLAALFLVIHLRQKPKSPPQFQFCVTESEL